MVCTKIGPPGLAVDPDITSPSSADITTQQTGWSWPVSTARGVGWFPASLDPPPSPTILCKRAFQCHSKTVQSSDPDAI